MRVSSGLWGRLLVYLRHGWARGRAARCCMQTLLGTASEGTPQLQAAFNWGEWLAGVQKPGPELLVHGSTCDAFAINNRGQVLEQDEQLEQSAKVIRYLQVGHTHNV
mgnify:CR=1 FL=1